VLSSQVNTWRSLEIVMATRNIVSGDSGPYGNGLTLISSGLNDPKHKSWNAYTLHRSSNNSFGVGGYKPGFGDGVISWTNNDELKLLDKLSTAAQGHDFNAGVFVGTAHEVARTVVGSVTAIYSGIKSLKRGDLNGALRGFTRSVGGADRKRATKKLARGDIAGTWLALHYGWQPLYRDTYSAMNAMEVLSKPPRESRIIVSRNLTAAYDGSQSPSLYTAPGYVQVGKRYYYTMTEELSFPRSVGLTDPASVVWELIPYSFVVDWFVPVGTYLHQLSTIPFLKGRFAVTTKSFSLCRFGENLVPPNPYGDYQRAGGGRSTMNFSRSPESSVPPTVPRPNFKGFSALFSSATRVGNAIALLSQLVKGKSR
ncbi:maturation protein, partial [ssRNA phage SRR6960799_9]